MMAEDIYKKFGAQVFYTLNIVVHLKSIQSYVSRKWEYEYIYHIGLINWK